MKPTAHRSAAFLAALLLATAFGGVFAAPARAQITVERVSEMRYFTADIAAFVAFVPSPPAAGDLADQADIETLLQVQRDRTPAQTARARAVARHNGMSMAAHVFGPDFTPANLPRTAAFLKIANLERHNISESSKNHYARIRPYNRPFGIHPCVKKPQADSFSYPSGHSTAGALWAALLAEAMPDYKTLFSDLESETMWCRVIGGVHYPTDTTAGRLLGRAIAVEMLKNPLTQAAVADMRDEIQTFLKTNPAAAGHAKKMLAKTKK